jgi:formylglycine-generating enzyme required for sulfatase activity
MVWIPGGEFSMGAQDRPMRTTRSGCRPRGFASDPSRFVDGFWMDRTEVTNEQFAAFVSATGYVTVAEQTPRAEDFPGARPRISWRARWSSRRRPRRSLDDHFQWWSYVKGASWRHPLGPDSSIDGMEKLPVVHVAYPDALAYASGLESGCRPKRSGSSRRAAASRDRSFRGATSSSRAENG